MYYKIIIFIFLAACSVPNSKLTSISINARLLDLDGKPISNKKLEVTLPASYGMKDIDLEYSEPEDIGKYEQTAVVKTDLTGTFTHTFEKVNYNTAYWFFPPLGNFPKKPPSPSFVIRMQEPSNAVYSIGWNDEGKLNYAVMRSRRSRIPPYILTGTLLRAQRGQIPVCIADFNFRKTK